MSKITLGLKDCIEGMKTIDTASIDAIITDPPFNITRNSWDTLIPYKELWEQLLRVSKPNAPIVLFAAQPFTSSLITSNLKHYRHSWVWKKNRVTNFLNAKKSPLKTTEDIVVFSKKAPNYYPQDLIPLNQTKRGGVKTSNYNKFSGEDYNQQYTNYPRNLLEFPCVQRTKHPTQKPVPLLEYLVKTYTKENETVLDFTMGVGSTLQACKNTNRNFTGFEIAKEYYDLAVEVSLGLTPLN